MDESTGLRRNEEFHVLIYSTDTFRTSCKSEEVHMSFGLYMVGYIVLIVGLAIGAHLMHIPPRWIGVGVVCMIGLGILTGVTTTRQRDPPQ